MEQEELGKNVMEMKWKCFTFNHNYSSITPWNCFFNRVAMLSCKLFPSLEYIVWCKRRCLFDLRVVHAPGVSRCKAAAHLRPSAYEPGRTPRAKRNLWMVGMKWSTYAQVQIYRINRIWQSDDHAGEPCSAAAHKRWYTRIHWIGQPSHAIPWN